MCGNWHVYRVVSTKWSTNFTTCTWGLVQSICHLLFLSYPYINPYTNLLAQKLFSGCEFVPAHHTTLAMSFPQQILLISYHKLFTMHMSQLTTFVKSTLILPTPTNLSYHGRMAHASTLRTSLFNYMRS